MPLEFRSNTHQYFLDGKEIPSVSKLLEPINQQVYDQVDQSILHQAAFRGSTIHKATEIIDAGGTPKVPEKWDGYIKAFEHFLKEHDVQWQHIEQMFASVQYGYAGTIDRIGEIDGWSCIVDIKTSYKIHEKLVIPQLTAYEMLCLEKIPPKVNYRLYILGLQNNGRYELKEFRANRKLVKSLIKLYKFMNQTEEVF